MNVIGAGITHAERRWLSWAPFGTPCPILTVNGRVQQPRPEVNMLARPRPLRTKYVGCLQISHEDLQIEDGHGLEQCRRGTMSTICALETSGGCCLFW